ncbi:uncharacterized protein FFB20_08457 [Fusarium fujikuroi]|nr:uncharacterized protein FFB20_08457 [Fusarium fujikuroi]
MSAEALDSLDLLKKGKKTLLNLIAVAKCRIYESDFLPGVDYRWRSRGGIQIGAKDFKNSIIYMLIFNSFDVWIYTGIALDHM